MPWWSKIFQRYRVLMLWQDWFILEFGTIRSASLRTDNISSIYETTKMHRLITTQFVLAIRSYIANDSIKIHRVIFSFNFTSLQKLLRIFSYVNFILKRLETCNFFDDMNALTISKIFVIVIPSFTVTVCDALRTGRTAFSYCRNKWYNNFCSSVAVPSISDKSKLNLLPELGLCNE